MQILDFLSLLKYNHIDNNKENNINKSKNKERTIKNESNRNKK